MNSKTAKHAIRQGMQVAKADRADENEQIENAEKNEQREIVEKHWALHGPPPRAGQANQKV